MTANERKFADITDWGLAKGDLEGSTPMGFALWQILTLVNLSICSMAHKENKHYSIKHDLMDGEKDRT